VREFFDRLNCFQEVVGEFTDDVLRIFLCFVLRFALRCAAPSVCVQINDRAVLVVHAFPRMEGRGLIRLEHAARLP
jgi:hypothetical protein